MNNTTAQYIEEDEIDLRELFNTILCRKKLIIIMTLIITLLAGVYAFMKTPIYEAKALIEIGNYKIINNNNNNNKILLSDPAELTKKLEVLFIDQYENDKKRTSKVSAVTIPKKSKNFISITSEGTSNKLAIQEIKKVVSYIQNKDDIILNDVKKRRELKIKNIVTDIKNIKNKEVVLIENKIHIEKEKLKTYTNRINSLSITAQNVQEKNPTLAALLLLEENRLSDSIYTTNIKLMDLQNKKETVLQAKINNLIEQKQRLESMLLPYNYKNSQVVAKIITNDFPSKPKKKLIIVVAFITGLILSIFLVFFLEFLASMREEETK